MVGGAIAVGLTNSVPVMRWRMDVAAVGRAEQALEQFQAAIQTRPDFFAAHVNLGVIFQEVCLHAEAVKTLDRAVVLRPDFAEARYWMVLSLRALGRMEEARCEYHEARRLKPELPAVAV